MTDNTITNAIRFSAMVAMLGAWGWFLWEMGKRDAALSASISKCIVDQNQPADWCWHWANAQRWK